MSLLTLAARDDIAPLLPLVAASHAGLGLSTTEDERRAALEALHDQDIQAAIWLIGPRRAPVGYVAVSFGFSLARGGREATIDEIFVRQAVRGRGMGSQALHLLLPMLREMGVRAVHVTLPHATPRALALLERAGFAPRRDADQLSRPL